MSDAAEPLSKQIGNFSTPSSSALSWRNSKQNIDYTQLLALKEIIAEFEFRNQRHRC